jgi:hypothetical protein
MVAITTEQAEKLLASISKSYKKICPQEKLTFKPAKTENDDQLVFFECINNRRRAKVIVGLDDKGAAKIISSYPLGPDSPALNLMPRIKVKKNETRFTTRHGSKAREC